MLLFAGTATLYSCGNSSSKLEDSKENVADAKADLAMANQEYLADVENYRKEVAAKIDENDKKLAELKVKARNEKRETKEAYDKKIAELEERNRSIREKMANYKDDGKDNWNNFKTEFNHDMDELGQAFKDVTVNNVRNK